MIVNGCSLRLEYDVMQFVLGLGASLVVQWFNQGSVIFRYTKGSIRLPGVSSWNHLLSIHTFSKVHNRVGLQRLFELIN